MINIYNGLLLSHKKEWDPAIWSNMDGPQIPCCMKLGGERQTWFHTYVASKNQTQFKKINLLDRKQQNQNQNSCYQRGSELRVGKIGKRGQPYADG